MAQPMDTSAPGENEQDDWGEGDPESDARDVEEYGDDGDLTWIEHSKEERLNMKRSYAPHWQERDGFREIYQNWRDAILRSARMNYNQFKPKKIVNDRSIVVEVRHPETQNLLGYILFKFDNKDQGQMEVTNFGAQLQRWHLSLGGTSKAGDKSQAGQFGEGMKMGALALSRANYTVRMVSTSFRWSFFFKKTDMQLALRLVRIDAEKVRKERKNVKPGPRDASSRSWEDVSVIVGTPGDVRVSRGKTNRGSKIPKKEFLRWLKVTIDIDTPSSLVRTEYGDLIMDPAYRNQIYLRGLLLSDGSTTGKRCCYAYNFFDGKTNRDRQALGGSKQESSRIKEIWAAAIRTSGPDLVEKYTNLILGHFSTAADAMFDDEDLCLDQDIAQKVWNRMLELNRDGHKRPFYYDAGENQDAVEIITKNLDKKPVVLNHELWGILRNFKLCRTPAEEEHHLFSKSRVLETPNTLFARHMDWMLQCCGQLDATTRNHTFEFVEAGNLSVNTSYANKIWKIHAKWLSFKEAQENTYCEEPEPSNTEPFCCDHAVIGLWHLMISQAAAADPEGQIAQQQTYLKSIVQTRLIQTPRNIKCTRTDYRQELQVSWTSVDSFRNREKPIIIELHAVNCTNEPSNSWHNPINITSYRAGRVPRCDCPTIVSHVGSLSVTFKDLDPLKEYFAKVARHAEGAFWALESSSETPLRKNLFKVPKTDLMSNSRVSSRLPSMSVTLRGSPAGERSPTIIGNPIEEDEDSLFVEDDGRNPLPPTRASSVNVVDHQDNESLYRDPSVRRSPPPNAGTQPGPIGFFGPSGSTQPRRPINGVVHGVRSIPRANISRDSEVDSTFQGGNGEVEMHFLGDRIEHNTLDWGGSFPGSHNFYRTLEQPEDDIFILKPKRDAVNEVGKRAADESGRDNAWKKFRYA